MGQRYDNDFFQKRKSEGASKQSADTIDGNTLSESSVSVMNTNGVKESSPVITGHLFKSPFPGTAGIPPQKVGMRSPAALPRLSPDLIKQSVNEAYGDSHEKPDLNMDDADIQYTSDDHMENKAAEGAGDNNSSLPPVPPGKKRFGFGRSNSGGGQPPISSSGKIKTKRKKRKTLFTILMILFVILSTLTGGLAYYAYQLYAPLSKVTNQQLPGSGTPGATATTQSDILNASSINILLLGSDNDNQKFGDAVLTQTDMIAHLDIKNHKVTLVSLPRDLYIPINGNGAMHKLDEVSGIGGGSYSGQDAKLHGFALTKSTIENDFHIKIDYYAWVGLSGFINVINTVGGVDVDVLHPIVDDTYPDDINTQNQYAYRRLYIPAGPQHLDGVTALQYVRSRHSDLLGDFGRAQRQQSVLTALKKKLENPTVITQLPQLAGDLSNSVLTDLTVQQLIALAAWGKNLNTATDETQVVLGEPTYATSAQISLNGQPYDIVKPNWTAINKEVDLVFNSTPAQSTSGSTITSLTSADQQTVQTDNAKIQIENGANINGLAAKAQSDLQKEGFTVTGIDTAKQNVNQTEVLVYNSADMNTANILGQILNAQVKVVTGTAPNNADIDLILGPDASHLADG